ncbi:MgtC/SapB family protein [Denitratisoma oestradiolicum]|uniref:Magnesium transporter MgtC n=1 Tax=Denitratisoma oestradiolicum TaxID=311182 RepID=A0A6S6XPW8_9PROT|nr:MgtC/SapB family protein [Denitratisoma oestradiolicum]TWO79364.1 magnesium transporter MgtC [Denitratisoma oestradiolicum]CAB1367976.1 Magnesium transporter MgtC [Denitratisoma oestradiolicum]
MENTAAQVQLFATSLAIGLLIGLERERKPDAKAGVRTYALTALLGTLSALLAREVGSGWVVALGLVAVGGMMMAAIAQDPHDDGDPGTTSVVALMIAYGLGAAVWLGHDTLAVMLGIATTILLYFKSELHGFSSRITPKDLISVLQFGVLSFIILPILPNQDFGPFAAFNPHQIWWLVVLISGLSLAGYVALRLIGARHGAAVIGIFGGLASSTATTMIYARHARARAELTAMAALVILLANLTVLVRLALVALVVAPPLFVPLLLVLGCGLGAGLVFALGTWLRLGHQEIMPMPEIANPTELRAALSFGALYAVILLLAAWIQEIAGNQGLYAVSLASGLTDVDAIALSSLKLFNLDKLGTGQAVIAVALAVLANLAFKTGLVLTIGGRPLAARALPGLAAIGAGIGGALLFTV